MKHENRKECSLGIACVDQPSRWDSVSSFTIITDIKVDSLLARFTPFREEHSRHQVAVTTPSCVGPPVIKQEQTIIHRRERGLFSSQADRCSFKTIDCRSLNRQRRTHHSNGRRRRISNPTHPLHDPLSRSSGIGLQRERECFEAQRSQSPLPVDLGGIYGVLSVLPLLELDFSEKVLCTICWLARSSKLASQSSRFLAWCASVPDL